MARELTHQLPINSEEAERSFAYAHQEYNQPCENRCNVTISSGVYGIKSKIVFITPHRKALMIDGEAIPITFCPRCGRKF